MKNLIFLFFISICLSHFLHASTFERLTLERLVKNSDLIVEGKVISVRSQWNDKETMIYTDVQIEIEGFLKNDDGKKTIIVRLIGGRVGNTAVFSLGSPSLNVSEKTLLILKENSNAYLDQFIGASETVKLGKSYSIVGGGQGKFKIVDNLEAGKIVTQDIENMHFINSIGKKELNQLSKTSLAKFKNAIKEISNFDIK